MQIEELITKASAKLGSEYKVAKAVGATPQRLSDWKTGRATCMAEDRALLADIAGEDPLEEIVTALMERAAGKPKEARLRDVLMNRLKLVGNFCLSHMRRRRKKRHREPALSGLFYGRK